MWIGGKAVGGLGDADVGHGGDGDLAGLVGVDSLVQEDGFEDLVADGVDWVEAGHRLLEDHGDLVAADVAYFLFVVGEQIARAVVGGEHHLAAVPSAWWAWDEVQCAHGGYGLAASGFADDGEGLAWVDGHAHAVDGLDAWAVAVVEADGKVFDLEEGRLFIERAVEFLREGAWGGGGGVCRHCGQVMSCVGVREQRGGDCRAGLGGLYCYPLSPGGETGRRATLRW